MCCDNHNRLDKIRHTLQFHAPQCGAISRETGKPDYCCFDCPVLQGVEEKLPCCPEHVPSMEPAQ